MSNAEPHSSSPKSAQAGLDTPFSPHTPQHRSARAGPLTPPTPLRTAAIKEKYPNAPELLLALVIASIEDDVCTSADDVKRRLSDLVDNVFEHDRDTSPTPNQSSQPPLRVKETIAVQVPKFVDFLYKDYKKRVGPHGNSTGQSPKKKRKKNAGSQDPSSFSEEDENESLYPEGNPLWAILLINHRRRFPKYPGSGGKL